MTGGLPVDDPGGFGVPLDEVFVWVTAHGEGDESLAAMITSTGVRPLVTQRWEVAQQLRPVVQELVSGSGKPARLVRLVRAEVVDEVGL